jgi:hypothetical protein
MCICAGFEATGQQVVARSSSSGGISSGGGGGGGYSHGKQQHFDTRTRLVSISLLTSKENCTPVIQADLVAKYIFGAEHRMVCVIVVELNFM